MATDRAPDWPDECPWHSGDCGSVGRVRPTAAPTGPRYWPEDADNDPHYHDPAGVPEGA